MEELKLKFKIPGADAPGYLDRVEKSLKFRQSDNTDPESVQLLIDWLSEFVVEPTEPEDVQKALRRASKDQIDKVIDAINSAGRVAPEAEGNSEDT